MKYILILITLILLPFAFKTVEAARMAPKEVDPVTSESIRYTAPHFDGLTEGMEHNGGYVEAIDIKTNKRLWLKEVYKPKYDPSLEGDVQDVFITSLTIENNKLIIINEKGEKFSIDLTDNSNSMGNSVDSAPSVNHIISNIEKNKKQKDIYTFLLPFVGIAILIAIFYLLIALFLSFALKKNRMKK